MDKKDLSKKEKVILTLIGEGFTNREIAGKLSNSVNTIHVHRNHIMHKLGIKRHAHLIKYAIVNGFTTTVIGIIDEHKENA